MIDQGCVELDMGSEFNEATIEPENCSHLFYTYINDLAKGNRNILIDCMEKVGIINYPAEW